MNKAASMREHAYDNGRMGEYVRPADWRLRKLGGRLIWSSNDAGGTTSFSPTDIWEFDDGSLLRVAASSCEITIKRYD